MRPIILCAALVWASGAAESTRFETASLTPSRASRDAYSVKVQATPEPVRLTMENVTLKFCVQQAYSVTDYQVSGPAWINHTRYDIVATLPSGTAPDQVWGALQTLLGERLKVAIRREKKEVPVYLLHVAKNGPKLGQAEIVRTEGAHSVIEGSGTLRLDNASLAKFCDELSRCLDRPVVDATGIPGAFDFNLRYAKAGDMFGPSIFSALERQLGLKLDRAKRFIELIIVDHAVRKPVTP